jgi:hypothetical protein
MVPRAVTHNEETKPVLPRKWRELLDEDWPRVQERLDQVLARPFPLPLEFRARVSTVFYTKHRGTYDLGDIAEQLRLSEDFLQYAFKLAGAHAVEYLARNKEAGRKLNGALRSKLPRRGMWHYRTPEERERNAELLAFVSERIVGFLDLIRGERVREEHPDPFLPGHSGPAVSVWGALRREWNRVRPDRPYTTATTLARAYSRAIDPERPLLREFVEQVRREVRAAAAELQRRFHAADPLIAKRLQSATPGLVEVSDEVMLNALALTNGLDELGVFETYAVALEPKTVALFGELEELAGATSAQEDVALPSDDERRRLVANRVLKFVYSQLMFESHGGPSPEDEEIFAEAGQRLPQEPTIGERLLALPLRDWFLSDARGEPRWLIHK